MEGILENHSKHLWVEQMVRESYTLALGQLSASVTSRDPG